MPRLPRDFSHSVMIAINVAKRLELFGIDNDKFAVRYANAVLDELKHYGELDYVSRIKKREPKDICYNFEIPNYRTEELYKILALEFSPPEEIYELYMKIGDDIFDIMKKDAKPRIEKALEDFKDRIKRVE